LLEDLDFLLAVDGFRMLLAEEAGLVVEDIALDDLGGDIDLSMVDGAAGVAAITTELEGTSGIGVHIVLVESIEAGEGKTVLGKATGLPGAPAHPMLPRRGAVVLARETWPSELRRPE
jgi:hypothetical protein